MEQLHSKVVDYISEVTPGFKKQGLMFTCPLCKSLRCHIFNHKAHCLNCQTQLGTIFDIVRRFEEDKKSWTDDDIVFYLKNKYNIDILTKKEVNDVLSVFEQNGFDLVPVVRNRKNPIELDWVNKTHLDKHEWLNWLSDGLNLGVKTGARSKITVLDFDTREIPSSILALLPPTLTQETTKGFHYIYQHEPSLPNSRLDDIKLDILNDGRQFVVFPSVVDNIRRRIKVAAISKMSTGLINFLKQNTLPNVKSISEKLKEQIITEDFSDVKLSPVQEGSRNNLLVKIGGILKKQGFNIQETETVVNVINRNFCKPPLPDREIRGMMKSLDRYFAFDDKELAVKVFKYLRIVEEASPRDVKEAIGETKERVDTALAYLVKEGFLIKRRRMFCVIKRLTWKDTFMSDGLTIKYKMPYFDDVATFRDGDMILIGGQQKVGKTHIAMNIIKQLVEQNIKPHYISLESGSRYTLIAKQLQMGEGDFWTPETPHFSVVDIELEKNAITIIDWLLPKDYADTDKTFQYFSQQLVKNGGILIIFVQLKKNADFFAENMIAMFPALVCRYKYDQSPEGKDNHERGFFEVMYMREPKGRVKHAQIHCHYDWQTKRLNVVQDTEKEDDEKFLVVSEGDL